MFVLTLDQRGSRRRADLVPAALATIAAIGGDDLAVAAERTVGDEVQTATTDAAAALRIVLALSRDQEWSIGVGCGPVDHPLPDSVRAGRGEAFIRAREAVERAKRSPARLAVDAPDREPAADAEALLRLLVDLRDRRSAQGWEAYDLLAEGLTQRRVAQRLGITEAAVSLRVRAAGIRIEESAVPALERVLARIDPVGRA